MAERETSRDIDAAAAAWVAREDRAPLTSAEEAALDAWLHADARNPGALLRARAVALKSESARALGAAYDPADFGGVTPAPSRRRVLAWGGGMAASLAGAAAVGMALRAPKAHATDRGEVRLVPLDDGSTVVLNTATRVTVRYDGDHREVRLVEGEADFNVLADARRPFVVQADDRSLVVTAVGGFRVRKLKDAPLDILVHQGRVAIAPQGAGAGRPVVLETNTRLVLSQGAPAAGAPSQPQAVEPGAVTRELAWRDGKIAFQGETLAQAAAAFGRYSDVRIVIEDPALAREPVTGLFSTNDPVGFGRAVGGLFDVAVEERGGAVIVGAASSPV